ncbi:hypothetical protein SAMN06269250_6164 [Spirosoma fluviale]|uniref:Uncharacterized protein n=1 Tax=Spirosoma fluviale TaxID=1597977 RepID=A0A286GTT0_9BACT|nr:hypothetical protein SAMN06269250_6164 [Spirosoma fluviale]
MDISQRLDSYVHDDQGAYTPFDHQRIIATGGLTEQTSFSTLLDLDLNSFL